MYILAHSDVELVPAQDISVYEASDDEGPLDTHDTDEQVEADTAEAVALEESHQETKAHEDHNIHVLEIYG